MPILSIKVFYAKGIRVSIKNRSFFEAMNLVWISPAFSDYDPIKIVFDSTGKTLYADKNSFHDYLRNDITIEELILLTQCDNIYRNTKELTSQDDFTVDAGSLWKATNKELTLIDDDNQVTAQLNKLLFEIAEE